MPAMIGEASLIKEVSEVFASVRIEVTAEVLMKEELPSTASAGRPTPNAAKRPRSFFFIVLLSLKDEPFRV